MSTLIIGKAYISELAHILTSNAAEAFSVMMKELETLSRESVKEAKQLRQDHPHKSVCEIRTQATLSQSLPIQMEQASTPIEADRSEKENNVFSAAKQDVQEKRFLEVNQSQRKLDTNDKKTQKSMTQEHNHQTNTARQTLRLMKDLSAGTGMTLRSLLKGISRDISILRRELHDRRIEEQALIRSASQSDLMQMGESITLIKKTHPEFFKKQGLADVESRIHQVSQVIGAAHELRVIRKCAHIVKKMKHQLVDLTGLDKEKQGFDFILTQAMSAFEELGYHAWIDCKNEKEAMVFAQKEGKNATYQLDQEKGFQADFSKGYLHESEGKCQADAADFLSALQRKGVQSELEQAGAVTPKKKATKHKRRYSRTRKLQSKWRQTR
ncbi:hypothetical protein BVY01_00755 [bacterium I07]|nr:hypothetical protein BVY01_00755 [bacterium I07]